MEARPHHSQARSRRDLMIAGGAAAAGAAGAIVALSGAGSRPRRLPSKPPTTTTRAEVDLVILGDLLELERQSIDTYTRATQVLAGQTAGLVDALLIQEQQHAAAVTRSIRDLGGTPARGPRGGLYGMTAPAPRRRHDTLGGLRQLEERTVGAYADALHQLSTEDIRVTVAAIMAAEAEHLAAVLGELGVEQLEATFVYGFGGVPDHPVPRRTRR